MARHSNIGQAKAAGHQPLPWSVHAAEAGSATVPEEVFTNITKIKIFVSFSGLSKHIIPAAWTVALEYNKTKDAKMVGLVWQSAFAVFGDAVQRVQAMAASCAVHAK